MRRRLLLSMLAIAVISAGVLAVPLAFAGQGWATGSRLLILACACVAVAAALAAAASRSLAAPLRELAEAAGRLRSGDPRPLGRRYGVAELDEVADGLDSAARRVASLLDAERELAVDVSHQLRTPLTALSMRLEEMIAAAGDPDVVREEGTAALAQAERLDEVVTQLLSPARRSAGGTAALTGIDNIIAQQVREWEPAFRRAGRRLVVIGDNGL